YFSSQTLAAFKSLEDLAKQSGQSVDVKKEICTSLAEGKTDVGQLKSVTVKSNDGTKAVVTVVGTDSSGNDQSDDVHMVKESSGWKIDLSQELASAGGG